MPRSNYVAIDKNLLYQLYHVEKKSLAEIGRMFDCHAMTISNRMEEFDIPRRTTSEASKLVERTPEWCAKISEANRGNILSEEARAKISRAHLGKPSPLKGLRKSTHPDKIKYGCPGEKHWNWKGGVSKEAVRIRQSSEYKVWRDAVFRRDNWTCVQCGQYSGHIEADHIKSFSRYPESRFDVNNGRTVCVRCHKDITKEQRKTDFC